MIAAACVGLVVMIVVAHLRPPSPPTIDVTVAAGDLPAGHVITDADLTTQVQSRDVPASIPAGDLIGERLIVGVPSGYPIAPTMLSGPGLADAAPPGTVVTTVSLADPQILQFAGVGDRIDLYLPPGDWGEAGQDAELLTSGALILAVPPPPSGDSGLLATPSAPADTSVIVLAVSANDATVLTGAGYAPYRAVLTTQAAP